MKNSIRTDRAAAYGLLRAVLGLNIVGHGVSRISAGTDKFAASLIVMFQNSILPTAFVSGFGRILPWVEAILGLMVLVGFWTRYGLAGGALLMFVLTFGTTLIQDWQTAAVQLSYALVFSLLLGLCEWNTFSVDRLLHLNVNRE